MIIKALKTFSDGVISMHEGEIANVPDTKAQRFIAEGYAVEYSAPIDEADLRDYAKLTDVAPLSAYISNAIENGATWFKTMPTDDQLLEMPDDTMFYAHGYYEILDGNGGYYKVTTTKTINSRKITDGTNAVYLIPLDERGHVKNIVNLCRYGIREYRGNLNNINTTNTYATLNSNIIESIVVENALYQMTWTLPRGRFYFERSINLSPYGINLIGDGLPKGSATLLSNSYIEGGSLLVFPFLNNGDSAIISGNGNIDNISVAGNKEYYDFSINREKLLTNPSEVVIETIKTITENEETVEFKCIGLNKTGNGNINNVYVMHFYEGIKTGTTSVYLYNIHCEKCHYGVDLTADAKAMGVYGWNVHTLVLLHSATVASINQVRVDSCVNACNIYGANGDVTLHDVDGDFCTDSLIKIGNGSSWTEVLRSNFTALHGRCCTLKSYNSNNDSKPSAVDLTTSNSAGYGLIHVTKQANFYDNYVQFAVNNRPALDQSAYNYLLMPDIAFTFEQNLKLRDNQFVISDVNVEDTTAYIKSVFQTGETDKVRNKISTAFNTYYVNGATVKSTFKVTDEQIAQIETLLNA